MIKDQLLELGLSEEQIKEVFRLNGLAVENAKTDTTELDGKIKTLESENTKLKEQIVTANNQIEGFENINVEDLEEEIKKYKKLYEDSEENFETELEKIKFKQDLKVKVLETEPHNVDDVISKFNIDNIKSTENGILGFDEEIKRIKENYPHYYPKTEGGFRGQDPLDPLRDDKDKPKSYEDFLNELN